MRFFAAESEAGLFSLLSCSDAACCLLVSGSSFNRTPVCGTCLTFWAGIEALLWSQTYSLCNVRGSTLLCNVSLHSGFL